MISSNLLSATLVSYYQNKWYLKQIKADIKAYEQGKKNAESAKAQFDEVLTSLKKDRDILVVTMKGESGSAFIDKLDSSIKDVKKRKKRMDEIISEYDKKINDLNNLKRASQAYVNTINNIIEGLKKAF